MLNCLRITDLAQVTGLLCPRRVALMGSVPNTYDWAQGLYEKLGKAERYQSSAKVSDWKP